MPARHAKPTRTTGSSARAGFTLIELTMSLAVVVLALGGVTAMLRLAIDAVPTADDTVSRSVRTLDALELLTADLSEAVTLESLGTSGMSFLVPDRDGDGAMEEITYTHGGSGSPLTRELNGGEEVALTDALTAFSVLAVSDANGRVIAVELLVNAGGPRAITTSVRLHNAPERP